MTNNSTKIQVGNCPVYLDSKGNLYDLLYNPIENYEEPQTITKEKTNNQQTENEKENEIDNENEIEKDQQKFISNDELLKNFSPKNLDKLPPFPLTKNYSTFDDFEQAVFDWKTEIEKDLGYLKPPELIGRAYSRPLYSPNSNETELLERKSSTYDRSSTGSSHEQSMLKRDTFSEKTFQLLNQNNNLFKKIQNFKNQTPQIMEGTNLVMIRKKVWDNELIPIEPDPALYMTYEEYEIALLNWEKTTRSNLKNIPMHSKEFAKKFKLLTALERERKEKERRTQEHARLFREGMIKKKKNRTILLTNTHFRWRERLDLRVINSAGNYGINALDGLMYQVYGKPFRLLKVERKIQKEMEREKGLQYEKDGLEREMEVFMQISLNQENEKSVEQLFEEKFGNSILNEKSQPYQQIKKLFIDLKNQNDTNLKMFNSPLRPLLGKFYGRILPTIEQDLKKRKSVRFNASHVDFSSAHLRRINLNQSILNKSKNCPDKINGQTVYFDMPQYQEKNELDYKKLKHLGYRKERRKIILEIEKLNFLNSLKSGYYPMIHTTDTIQKQKEFVKNIVQDSVFNINKLIIILKKRIYFDIFEEILADYIVYDGQTRSYSEIFSNILNDNNFHLILTILKDSSSFGVHANVCYLVSEILTSNICESIFTKYIQENNFECLYYIARSLNFFTKIPQVVFPFSSEISMTAKDIINCNSSFLENCVFNHYYLTIILNCIQEKGSYLFPSGLKIVQELISTLNSTFAISCESNPIFLEKGIYKAISCRSSTISGYYLFIFLYMIKVKDKLLDKILKSPSINLFGHLKIMSKSKFAHVKLACWQILHLLKKEESWISLIYNSLIENDFLILIKDLTPPPKPEDPNQPEDRKTPFWVELITDFLTFKFNKFDALNNQKMDINDVLPKPILFFKLTNHLKGLVEQYFTNNTLNSIANVMYSLINLFSRFDSITYGSLQDNSRKNLSGRKPRLFVDLSLLNTLLTIIKNSPKELNPMKAQLLSIITKILKFERVFQEVRNNLEFWNVVLSITRDSTTDLVCSKALKLFEEVVFHHSKMIDYLKNKKLLITWMNLLNSRNLIVIINSLNTISRIFNMANRENKRLLQQKKPCRNSENSLKLIEKDIKTLVNFFQDKALFVKLNMIYKNNSIKNGGLLFVNLAKVYSQIINNPSCKKILKINLRKSEYQEGLNNFSNYFSGFQEVTNKKSKTNSKNNKSKNEKKGWRRRKN
ncbi:sca1 complex scaffold protein scaa [Anaeramoeba flamelloides]|uniref:Sca1 complex scaffold protein scaa n=1 Tax=Anaeramoeba flamelloides TaxID=1746091 RepID=A0ABQ8YNQ6_9EUKA|nr:sca1 complex scaffold protein scaa [Anaeramoeba flamelloides]